MKTLILGGVRSGKSRLAERMAKQSGLPVTYVATAVAGDEEMRERIATHRAQRPADWLLIEEPLALGGALRSSAGEGGCIIVDCLTLWLTNLLSDPDTTMLEREISSLHNALVNASQHIILVSNETGMGIIPMGEITRRYCDEAGRLHQQLAQTCERVVLTIAGLPQILKGAPL